MNIKIKPIKTIDKVSYIIWYFLKIWINVIIIIMLRRLRGYPWPSLAISPYHSSPPAGLQSYIPCPHIAAVCKFVLVVPLLHIHVWGSTGVHRLWARPCFSSSVLRVWFVELVWFLWWGAGVRIVGVSWGVVARTCLILLSTFLCNFRPTSSPAASYASMWCIHIAVSTQPLPGRKKERKRINIYTIKSQTTKHS